MAGKLWTDEDKATLQKLAGRGLGGPAIAKTLGRSWCSVNMAATRLGVKIAAKPSGAPPQVDHGQRPSVPTRTFDAKGDSATLTFTTDTPCRTVADVMANGDVDADVWQVDRFVLNSWEMGYKTEDGDAEAKSLWQVKVWLKRIQPRAVDIALERVAATWKPTRLPKVQPRRKDDVCLELCFFDVHFGLLAWAPESGHNYDLKIAEQRYVEAAAELVRRASDAFDVGRIVLPVGSDFFHINDPSAQTPRGHNQLDSEGRLTKIFEVGFRAVLTVIEACRQTAPTEVIFVPGNHDPQTSYYLCFALKQKYANNSRVTVDVSPTCRKRMRHGVNLIGFTHGDEEPHRDLPTIMASEWPDDWAAATHREWHVGHRHKKKETHTVTADTFGPVRVRTIPSLCSSDAWHYRKGYVGPIRAAEGYLWHKDDGYMGHLSTRNMEPPTR